MQNPIIIDARQALRDIQSGMDDPTLMKKYNLSAKGLKSLFNKLAAAGFIRGINPREFISDIRSGIDDSGLMEKYRVSKVGLERLLRDLQDFGLLPVVRHPKGQSDKLTIDLQEIVRDIKASVSELHLISKYGMSAAGLGRILQKLLDAGAILPTDLAGISSSPDDTARISGTRGLARCYPILSLRVCEARNTALGGIVRDITEAGVGTAGLHVAEGEEKHLLASSDDVLDIKPFLFKGVCRWFQQEKRTSRRLAGFEIKEILDDSLRNLQEFIRFSTVKFQHLSNPPG